jgi:hypothetical protein
MPRATTKTKNPFDKSKKYITVLEAGWVFVGRNVQTDNGLLIEEAQNIRLWGTTTGLGQIALSGPTAETVLDNYGVIRVPDSKVLYTIPCEYDEK